MTEKQTKKHAAPHHDYATAPELSPELLAALEAHNAVVHTKVKHSVKASETEVEKIGAATMEIAADASDDVDDTFGNPENDAAVEDIVRHEADQLLEQTDNAMHTEPQEKRGFWRKIGHFFGRWWGNKWSRWITILIVLAALTTITAVPKYRYAVLNTFGVRASITVTVYDSDTRLPLKNITAAADGHQDMTDVNGVAKVEHVKLGQRTLQIKRFGFKTITQQLTVGWGSNPLDTFYITATGSQYTLTVTDFISGGGVSGAEVDSGLASAQADKNGVVTLTMDVNTVTADLSVQAKGYRTEKMHVDLTKSTKGAIGLVPAAKVVFLSKQSGTYDVVAMDADGQNRATLLQGTGRENANMALAVDSAHTHVALVSTRDDIRDSDGYLLSTLNIMGLSGGVQTVAHAEQIKLVDWIGTKLVFQEVVAGASASNSQRYKIISYDYSTNSQTQLANANQFNSVLSAQGEIYYAVSSTDPTTQPAFWRIKPDGSSRQNLMNSEAWAAIRSDYNTIDLQTPSGWFAYAINGSGTPQKIDQPGSIQNRIYTTNSTTHNVWVNVQNTQGTLSDYDTTVSKDRIINAQSGMNNPLYWLNDQTVVYRVATAQETADYAVSIVDGRSKKLTDVVNNTGLAPTN